MFKIVKYSILANSFLFPLISYAQEPGAIDQIVTTVGNTFNSFIIPALFVLATLIFIWGVIKYIAKSDDEKARAQAKQLMLWGIVGLVVITAVWSVVTIIITYFGAGGETIPGTGGTLNPPLQ